MFSKLRFFGKKVLKNALTSKNKKVKGILRELFILTLSFSAVFGLENRASDFFFLFVLFGR